MQLGRGGRAGAQQADGGEAADSPGGGETPARPTEPNKGQVLAPASPPALASEAPCPSPGSQEESAGPEETGAGGGHTPQGPCSLSALVRGGLGPPTQLCRHSDCPTGHTLRLSLSPQNETQPPPPTPHSLSSRQLPHPARALSFRPVPEPTCSASLGLCSVCLFPPVRTLRNNKQTPTQPSKPRPCSSARLPQTHLMQYFPSLV